MRSGIILIALAGLLVPAQAQDTKQDAKKSKTAPTQQRAIPRGTPKEQTLIKKFDLKSSDSGGATRQRLQLDLTKDKDIFIFGDRTTTYPTARSPGQEFQPAIPQATPKDTYSIGIGTRF